MTSDDAARLLDRLRSALVMVQSDLSAGLPEFSGLEIVVVPEDWGTLNTAAACTSARANTALNGIRKCLTPGRTRPRHGGVDWAEDMIWPWSANSPENGEAVVPDQDGDLVRAICAVLCSTFYSEWHDAEHSALGPWTLSGGRPL